MNRNATVSVGVVLALSMGLSGCYLDAKADSSEPETLFSVLHGSPFIDNGTFSDKSTKVLTSQSDYEAELLKYSGEAAAKVDFSISQVLVLDMGKRPDNGYSISVTSLELEDDHVVANVELSRSGENCVTAPALTNPFQFVAVNTVKDILIREVYVTKDCEQ